MWAVPSPSFTCQWCTVWRIHQRGGNIQQPKGYAPQKAFLPVYSCPIPLRRCSLLHRPQMNLKVLFAIVVLYLVGYHLTHAATADGACAEEGTCADRPKWCPEPWPLNQCLESSGKLAPGPQVPYQEDLIKWETGLSGHTHYKVDASKTAIFVIDPQLVYAACPKEVNTISFCFPPWPSLALPGPPSLPSSLPPLIPSLPISLASPPPPPPPLSLLMEYSDVDSALATYAQTVEVAKSRQVCGYVWDNDT